MRQNWGKSVWTDRKGSLPSFVFLFWFFVWLLVSFCVCVCVCVCVFSFVCVCVCVLCFCVVVFTVALVHCTAREKLRSESGSACLHTIKQNHATSFSFLFFSEWMELLHWNLRQVRSRIRVLLSVFHSGELQMQKLRSHLLRTQSSKVLLLKPGAGTCITMHATPSTMNFCLLVSTFPVHSAAFFPKPLPSFLGLCSEIVDIICIVIWEKETCGIMTCGMTN